MEPSSGRKPWPSGRLSSLGSSLRCPSHGINRSVSPIIDPSSPFSCVARPQSEGEGLVSPPFCVALKRHKYCSVVHFERRDSLCIGLIMAVYCATAYQERSNVDAAVTRGKASHNIVCVDVMYYFYYKNLRRFLYLKVC